MIATQNTGQGMLPLLQLLGGDSVQDLDGLKGLEGKLGGKEGEGFLAVLEPQMEALLASMGVPGEELEDLDLEAMLARLQDLLDGQALAADPDEGGNALPVAALMAATQEPGRPDAPRVEGSAARGGAEERALPVKPLPAAVMRLFVEAAQANAGRDGAVALKPDVLGAQGGMARDNVLEILAQWMGQGDDPSRRGRTDPLNGVLPAQGSGQAEGADGARALPRLDLTRLLQQPNGARELADQVRMLAQAQGGRTELKLHPPQLGSLDVRVLVEGDRTSIQFISANPVTREVLEAAMPRLRDSLAESGLQLEDATVSDQAAEEQAEQDGHGAAAEGVADGTEGDQGDNGENEGSTLSMLSRRLDLFA
ncbi:MULTISPECIES: flagellar hook-length control protein FliK [unclassified Thioalkalivibrio]|uniref:flagellar hook-length control protein FliK n=1 Tax=unclassified Thioalkalivibrio TaxID=2621013 RepID=UPI00037C45F6|nr:MULTISPECIES: flagellar hook-length control protein FliK [unclassified Thioalkalivibrio]